MFVITSTKIEVCYVDWFICILYYCLFGELSHRQPWGVRGEAYTLSLYLLIPIQKVTQTFALRTALGGWEAGGLLHPRPFID